LHPVDLGDCRLFLAYYQGRIIYLGSKWDRGWRWYALEEFWKMCNSYYALKNIAASLKMKETNFLKNIWKCPCTEFTHSSKELEDPVGSVTCKMCWDEKSPWLRCGRWWCYSCARAPCKRTGRWRNDGTYEFRRLQKNLYSQMLGDFTRDSLSRVWHSPVCIHLHQSIKNDMWCSHLLQRNVCKARTLLFGPRLRNIISCNLRTGLMNITHLWAGTCDWVL
jgi:hypothetical protein